MGIYHISNENHIFHYLNPYYGALILAIIHDRWMAELHVVGFGMAGCFPIDLSPGISIQNSRYIIDGKLHSKHTYNWRHKYNTLNFHFDCNPPHITTQNILDLCFSYFHYGINNNGKQMNHKKKTNLLKSIKKRIVFYDSPQKKKY